MRNISDKRCRENQNIHFVFNNFIFENRAVYEICGKNIVERGRPHTLNGTGALHAGYLKPQRHTKDT